jgi:hypothetical protein
VRHSLEVPGSVDTHIPAEPTALNGRTSTAAADRIGSPDGEPAPAASDIPSSAPAPAVVATAAAAPGVEKSGSLSRSSGRYSRITGIHRDSRDAGETDAPKPTGVTLEDKPMDD